MTKTIPIQNGNSSAPDAKDEHFSVLKNSEDQYWVWSEFNDILPPTGWTEVLKGNFQQCEAYLRKNWLDMRPRSLRE